MRGVEEDAQGMIHDSSGEMLGGEVVDHFAEARVGDVRAERGFNLFLM